MYDKLIGITIQTPVLGLGRPASLFIKVSMFDVYIEEAKIRLIKNQDRHANKRNNELYFESSSKRKKPDFIQFL